MTTEFAVRLEAVDQTILNPLVRQVVENEDAEVIDWTIASVSGGSGSEKGRTYGLYRFKGCLLYTSPSPRDA